MKTIVHSSIGKSCLLLLLALILGGGHYRVVEKGEKQEELPRIFRELGGKLAYIRNEKMSDHKIVLLSLKNGKKKVFDLNGKASMLSFSQDGNSVAARYTPSGRKKSYIASFEPEAYQMGTLADHAEEDLLGPAFSPEDTGLVYYRSRGRKKKVVLRSLKEDGGEPRAIPCQGDECFHPDHHPEDDKVLYIEGKTTMIEYDLSKKERDTLFRIERPEKIIELEEFEGKSDKEIKKIYKESDRDKRDWKRILRARQNRSITFPRYGPEGKKILFLYTGVHMAFKGGAYLIHDRSSGTIDTAKTFTDGQRPTSPCWVGKNGAAIAYGNAIKASKKRKRRRREEKEKSYRVYLHHLEKERTVAISREDRFAYSPTWAADQVENDAR